MDEVSVIKQLAEVSLPLAILTIAYVLFTRTIWPWYTGPYADERREQRRAVLEETCRREENIAKMTREFAQTMREVHQTQATVVQEELQAVQLRVAENKVEFTTALASLSEVMSTLFQQQTKQLELWRQDIAYVLRLFSEMRATHNGVSAKTIERLDKEDRDA